MFEIVLNTCTHKYIKASSVWSALHGCKTALDQMLVVVSWLHSMLHVGESSVIA